MATSLLVDYRNEKHARRRRIAEREEKDTRRQRYREEKTEKILSRTIEKTMECLKDVLTLASLDNSNHNNHNNSSSHNNSKDHTSAMLNIITNSSDIDDVKAFVAGGGAGAGSLSEGEKEKADQVVIYSGRDKSVGEGKKDDGNIHDDTAADGGGAGGGAGGDVLVVASSSGGTGGKVGGGGGEGTRNRSSRHRGSGGGDRDKITSTLQSLYAKVSEVMMMIHDSIILSHLYLSALYYFSPLISMS